MLLYAEKGRPFKGDAIKRLVDIHYERGDYDFFRGRFRVRGDILDIYPAYEEDRAVRVTFSAMKSRPYMRSTPFSERLPRN